MFLDKFYDTLMQKIMVLCDNGKKRYFALEFKEIDCDDDPTLASVIALVVSTKLEHRSIVNKYSICYTQKVIYYFIGVNTLKACFTIEIPYANRSKYIPFAKKINHLAGLDGLIIIAADNNPYHLQSILYVETNSNTELIQNAISEYDLRTLNDKGFKEIMSDVASKGWNMVNLSPDNDDLEAYFNFPFVFAEADVLANRRIAPPSVRKKIFISYSHKDKELVNRAVDAMKLYGLNLWIDKQELDAGDSLVEKIHSGIRESDLAVLFISKATVTAKFALHEVQILENLKINNEKEWFIVKVDDVNVNDVVFGLSDFLYYDLSKEPDLEKLVESIKRKLAKI